MKYLIKINRKKPNRSYYLTCDFRTCTYQRRHAYRFSTKEEALYAIADWACGGDEEPEIVEVEE